jgi:hypothetical protein
MTVHLKLSPAEYLIAAEAAASFSYSSVEEFLRALVFSALESAQEFGIAGRQQTVADSEFRGTVN